LHLQSVGKEFNEFVSRLVETMGCIGARRLPRPVRERATQRLSKAKAQAIADDDFDRGNRGSAERKRIFGPRWLQIDAKESADRIELVG
jgi:hypothetical protein